MEGTNLTIFPIQKSILSLKYVSEEYRLTLIAGITDKYISSLPSSSNHRPII